MSWPRLLILSTLTAALCWGCAPNSDNAQVQADQFALRGMVANNQQQIDSLQEKIRRLQDKVAELEHNGSASTGGSDQLASIEQRLDKLESQSTSAQPNAANTPAAAPTDSAPTPQPTASAAGAGGADNGDAAKSAPGNEEASAASQSNLPAAASEGGLPSWRAMADHELSVSHDDPGQKLYHAGLLELKSDEYSQALSQFEALQRHYPKSSLSEPAEFFAANSLYEMSKYDQAILQFNDQTMRFPKGHFASAALLREAQAFMKINDRIDARLTLQKLLNDLPDSPEAPMAKSMMQSLAS
jgi:TolA-binding protein